MTKHQSSKEYLENINFYKEMHNLGFYKSDAKKNDKLKVICLLSLKNNDGKKSFYPLQCNV